MAQEALVGAHPVVERPTEIGQVAPRDADGLRLIDHRHVDHAVWDLHRHRPDLLRGIHAEAAALDHGGPPMPMFEPAVAITTSQQPRRTALPAKQRPDVIPTSGTRPLRRAKNEGHHVKAGHAPGVGVPGRPPPPSVKTTTGSRSRSATSNRRSFFRWPCKPWVLTMLSFLVFGAVLLGPALQNLTWRPVIYALLSLTVIRMVPVALALYGSRLSRTTVAYIGWFGPRGLASVVLGLIVLGEGTPGVSIVTQTVAVTVGLSILAHDATAVPLASRYARWYELASTAALRLRESAPSEVPGTEARRGGPAG